jgi:hypothetical protein
LTGKPNSKKSLGLVGSFGSLELEKKVALMKAASKPKVKVRNHGLQQFPGMYD